jgi:hypothetical protein
MRPPSTKTIVIAATALVLGTGTAVAVEVKVQKSTDATPAAAWAAIGDFCNIAKWHPAIAKCEISKKGADTFRTLTLKGGGEVYEKQLTFDDAARSYSYTIETSPLPVKNYTAKMTVLPRDKGATLLWEAKFDAKGASDADAAKVITGIFESGLTALGGK